MARTTKGYLSLLPARSQGDGQPPLLWVAESGHRAVFKLLLATGRVDTDATDSHWRRTPLSIAA
jgi:hypothetical protein